MTDKPKRLKPTLSRSYRSIVVGEKRIVAGSCKMIYATVRLESANQGAQQMAMLDNDILPAFMGYLEGRKYTPGNYPCIDCLDCEEPCEHKGKEG